GRGPHPLRARIARDSQPGRCSMRGTGKCLDEELLGRVDSGQLSGHESEEVAQHVENCPACAEAVQRLPRQTRMAAAVREGGTACRGELSPSVEALIQRFRELSAADTGPATFDTVRPPPPGVKPGDEADVSALLAPA